ncbi:MAG: RNA 2',3'-cyclic phosphodiesterase [Candidatus Hydrogenedentes bacterium]|nr:RNA 2',3'-cyclic phosphodiesterase [Candidatus Hydrogenedentota bacterium]
MRAFLAIELPAPVREALWRAAAPLRASGVAARWVTADALHLTLRFFGELEAGQAAMLLAELRGAYAGQAPLRLRLEGWGVFPSLRRPSVVWAGVACEEGDLIALQRLAEASALRVGLAPESKPFHPHVTLGRIRNPSCAAELPALLAALTAPETDAFEAGHVSLLQSTLTPGGAIHAPLAEIELK